jgi:AraC family transcriptional regulator of adaptative response / DNA-3-methyladenine glycosylase II
MPPDFDVAYRAVSTRDTRFDGQFVTAVRTTRIYCRPACPARTPRRENVTFYATPAAAQAAGYRACRRCLPDAAPGSPEWNMRADTVGAAMRLIGDGLVDREGVPALARRLGYSERHLGRLLSAEIGASPLAVARARRADAARVLLTNTDLPISEIAYAAGFSSIRQFNETVREIYATDPSALRARRRSTTPRSGTITLRLPVRVPFDGDGLLAFLAARAVPGVEYVSGRTYARTLRLPRGAGTAHLTMPEQDGAAVDLQLRLQQLADLVPAVERCRRLIDADADPAGIAGVLAADPALSSLVRGHTGIRLPGAVDGPEILVRALVGQQISVRSARTTLGRLTALVGDQLETEDPLLTHLFPSSTALARLDAGTIGGPRRRADTILSAARDLADGVLTLHAGRRADDLTADLVSRSGIGPWTAGYVCMRVLGAPDVLLVGDLVLRQGAARMGLPAEPRRLTVHAERWRPFRSYAGLLLWRAAAEGPDPIPPAPVPGALSDDRGVVA